MTFSRGLIKTAISSERANKLITRGVRQRLSRMPGGPTSGRAANKYWQEVDYQRDRLSPFAHENKDKLKSIRSNTEVKNYFKENIQAAKKSFPK
jgi:hypothetical protein